MDFDINKVTKESFSQYIKPLVDKTIEVSGKLSLNEEILVKRFLKRIVNSETNPERLLKVLEEMTPLQASFAEKKGLKPLIDTAKEYLKSV